jgi:hypothetical protein
MRKTVRKEFSKFLISLQIKNDQLKNIQLNITKFKRDNFDLRSKIDVNENNSLSTKDSTVKNRR